MQVFSCWRYVLGVQGLNTRAMVTLGRKGSPDFMSLSVLVPLDEAGKPKTEVRLFKAGWNTTEIGEFLFDEAAAASTMAAYAKHGVPVIIDLEHLSLDPEAPNFDPRSRGRGAFELRDGELWLCSIKWTPDAVARITNGEELFLSPAFPPPGPDRRITKIHNVGLVAQPATDFAVPLAASANHRGNTMDPEQLKLVLKLSRLVRDGEKPEAAMTTLAIDMKTLQQVVKAMGGDPQGDLGALLGTVQAFSSELADMASGKKADKPADAPADGAAADGAPSMMSSAARELETLRSDASKMSEQLVMLKCEHDEREAVERRELVAGLVKLGREIPATAWADNSAKTPRGSLNTMPVEELREKVKAFGGLPIVALGAAVNPPKPAGTITTPDGVEISEFEAECVNRAADSRKVDRKVALARYLEVKGMQILGAKNKADHRLVKMVGRPLTPSDVILRADGSPPRGQDLVTLSTPVKPIEEFGASSQRALEQFRLDYNLALASQPAVWCETICPTLPSGDLKETYPISFRKTRYTEKVAGKAAARTANNKDVTITKQLYHAAEELELYRLRQNDFAYVRSWADLAGRMANARVFLRNERVVTLLEANGTAADGVAYFATTHVVDPFDLDQEFRSATVWSNLQDGTAAPLDATSLTAEKNLFVYSTPGPDGREIGAKADCILIPTILGTTAEDLLTVQQVILAADVQTGGTGRMGAVSNPHLNSGMITLVSPELAGTAVTANWYLVSLAAVARGLRPWVVSEDPNEEVLQWDETSDFYKETGFIKYESQVRLGAGLLYWHAIRKIQGT